MADPYRAFRQLERMLPGITHPRPVYVDTSECQLIATIIYKNDSEVVEYHPRRDKE